MINYSATKEDLEKIILVVERSLGLIGRVSSTKVTFSDGLLDLVKCHLNGNPLDLDGMLTGDEIDLLHDYMGISRNLGPDGRLTNGFVPRFSLR